MDFTAIELLLIFHPLDGDLWLLEQRLNPLPLLVSAVSHTSHSSGPLHAEVFLGQSPIKSNFLFVLDLPCFKSGRCVGISSQQTHDHKISGSMKWRRIQKKKVSTAQVLLPPLAYASEAVISGCHKVLARSLFSLHTKRYIALSTTNL